MIFSKDHNLSDRDKKLINNFLEQLINKSRDHCRKEVESNGFVFLDSWDNKMGFVKEREQGELILSLQFNDDSDQKCYNYQLIIKKPGQHWKQSQLLDYHLARNAGIVPCMLALMINLYNYFPVEPAFHALGC